MLFLLRSCNLLGSIVVIPAAGLGLPDRAVVAGELHVLVLPGERRALEAELLGDEPLHVVGHVDGAPPAGAPPAGSPASKSTVVATTSSAKSTGPVVAQYTGAAAVLNIQNAMLAGGAGLMGLIFAGL